MPALLPEDRDKLNQMILAKMQDTSDVDRALENQNTSNLVSNLGEAAEGIFKARSMAVGGQGVDSDFYRQLKDQAAQNTRSQADRKEQSLKGLLFQKYNFDDQAKAAKEAEKEQYQRGLDEKRFDLENKKLLAPDSKQNPFEIRSDEFGRLVRVNKNTGRAEYLDVQGRNAQGVQSVGSQMETDLNQPPSPLSGETRQQYAARMKLWTEKTQRQDKKQADMPELEIAPRVYARTKDDAKTLKEAVVSSGAAIQDLEDIKRLGTDVSMLDVSKRGQIQQKIMTAIGKLRLSVLGPGAMTDSEREFLRENIGDPSRLFSTEANEKAKLDQLINAIKDSTQRELDLRTQGNGATISQQPSQQMQQVPQQQQQRTVAKKQYSPSRNQTRIIYSDGTVEVLDGKQ